jgi:hypothetical protein
MDRFQEPTIRDEMYPCDKCQEIFHYESLNDDGLCGGCREDDDVDDVPKPSAEEIHDGMMKTLMTQIVTH